MLIPAFLFFCFLFHCIFSDYYNFSKAHLLRAFFVFSVICFSLLFTLSVILFALFVCSFFKTFSSTFNFKTNSPRISYIICPVLICFYSLEKFTSNPLSELSPLPHIFCTKKSTGNKLPAPNIITSKVQQTNPVMFKRCGLIKS